MWVYLGVFGCVYVCVLARVCVWGRNGCARVVRCGVVAVWPGPL